MSRTRCAMTLVTVLSLGGAAYAQEVGARRIEVGVATGAGMLFLADSNTVSRFGAYSVGGTLIINVTENVGVEGDFGLAAGRHQDLTFAQTTLFHQKTPSILNYNGTLIYSPLGVHHVVASYLAVGMGGLTMLHAPDTDVLGLTNTRTFLTANAGGGVNWFPVKHLGVRGDYRFIIIRNQNDAPLFFGQEATRYAHRIYGALILTY